MENTMNLDLDRVARETGLPMAQVEKAAELLQQGDTAPFIARFRKIATQGLDETQILRIQEEIGRVRAISERKQTVLRTIQGQARLTEPLQQTIEAASSLKRLDDIYLPFKFFYGKRV